MDNNRKKRNQMLAQKVMKGLESRGMEGYYAETKDRLGRFHVRTGDRTDRKSLSGKLYGL